MVSVGYFDTYEDAIGLNLSAYTDIYTLGRKKKNDGGGAHYKRYDSVTPPLGFRDAKPGSSNRWGLIPDGGSVNPLQAGGGGGGETDLDAIQACIDFIQWWNETTTESDTPAPSPTPPGVPVPSKDSNRSAIKLVIPANRTFVVNTGGDDPQGLRIRSSITIEGEDRFTSVIMLDEASGADDSTYKDLFHAEGEPVSGADPTPIFGITLRNFTMRGSYLGSQTPGLDLDDLDPDPTQGSVSLFTYKNVRRLLIENMVFERNRAVAIGGSGVRGLTMRGCLLSQIRRGGMVINGAADVSVENNDFRWVLDDPIAINGSATVLLDQFYLHYGASIRIAGNRCLGSRGLNVVGVKNVLIEGNIHILGRGRAIHVGVVSDQEKSDTTALNVIVRSNIILDLLDAEVDPVFKGGTGSHRAIDIELLDGGPGGPLPGSPNFIPGLPNGTQTVADPTQYYYTIGQGTSAPAPHAANVLVEGNIVARTRPPVVGSGTNSDHIAGFDNFESYGLGKYGSDTIGLKDIETPIGFTGIQIPLAFITPSEGIAVTGAVRNLTLRGNRIGGCDTAILFKGYANAPPLPLLDVVVENNDLSDWTVCGIQFLNYANQAQRVSILNNRGNGDPFHRNQLGTVRLNGGVWANTATGAFLDVTEVGYGLGMIAGNHVRNVSQLIVGFDPATAKYPMQDNVGYCDPNELGYHVQNRGIGNLIPPQFGWRYVIEGGDPTNLAQYGIILNPCPLATATIPTSGKWVAGTYVKCSQPTTTTRTVLAPPAGTPTTLTMTYELLGWRRMTTDSNHALGTRWQQQWALIGPA